MAKIPFSIDYRPQIESGEYKVETRSGKTARVVCWDRVGTQLVVLVGKDEDVLTYNPNGTTGQQMPLPSNLFIVTPEPELTEFEKAVQNVMHPYVSMPDDIYKEAAVKLLDLARKEFIKQGYVIEKKTFHDAVENISNKHKAEMSVEYALHCKVENGLGYAVMNWNEFQKVAKHFINYGKAEALKDLPRWRVSNAMRSTLPITMYGDNGMILYKDGFEISIFELEKLPKEN